MSVGYKYCMECGSKLSDDDTVMEKNREEMDDIDWDVLLNSTAEDENDLEKLRDNIKQVHSGICNRNIPYYQMQIYGGAEERNMGIQYVV